MSHRRARPTLRSAAIAAALCLLAGCAADRTELKLQAAPPPRGKTVLVDAFVPAEPAWERLARRLRSRLADDLNQTGEVTLITAQQGSLPAQRPLVLSGELVEADAGSEAVRFLVGMGLGNASLRAHVRIVDATNGQPVLEFDQTRTSRAGSGLGAHWNPTDMDNEIDALAAAAAETVTRWLNGQTL